MKSCCTYVFAVVLLVMATTVMMATPASAESGKWGVGAGAIDGDFTVQARKNFWLGGDISQITAQAGLTFHNRTTVRLDADYHFILKQGKSRFYPLVGIDFAFNDDAAKFGVNAGGGINFRLTEKLNGFGEVKYIFGDWDGWSFLGGVYF